MKQIERLRSLMAPEEPGEWSEHDGGGRPNKPGSYVEVERRSGERQVAHSAFFYWCGCGLSEDIIRWRLVKEPPTDKVLASFVPSLLSHIDALEARVVELTKESADLKHYCRRKQEELAKEKAEAKLWFEKAQEPDVVISPIAARAEAAERALAEAVEVISHLVRSVDDLISESEGVYGLHLNGDPAPWYSLTEGGHFESWLIELERARAFIAKMGEK